MNRAEETVKLTGTTSSGRPVTALVTVGADPAPPVLYGVDPSESTNTDHQQDIAWFAGSRIGAVYGSAGEGVPGWSTPYVSSMLAAGYQLTFSAKDTAVAGFQAHWAGMPAGDDPVYYTIRHECNKPTGGPTASSWRASFTALHQARLLQPAAIQDRIKLGAVFSWWPAQIGHNEGTPWADFITGLEGLDWIGWDQYYAAGIGQYSDPTLFTQLPYDSGVQFGVPVIIREFGVAGSQTDQTAANFINAVKPVYDSRSDVIRGVSYFQYTAGVSSARLTPTGRPLAFAAWQGVCSGQ